VLNVYSNKKDSELPVQLNYEISS